VIPSLRTKGYWVTYEYKISEGKSVDLVAEKYGKRISIEIESGKSDFVFNITKVLNAGFNELLVVALDEKIREKISEYLDKIPPYNRKKISVSLANSFQN
jgi:predicted RecB family endonuclease